MSTCGTSNKVGTVIAKNVPKNNNDAKSILSSRKRKPNEK